MTSNSLSSPATALLSIGALSRISGLSAHTLRFYETQGILQPAGRADNGHRRYRNEDVLWLHFVLRLKRTDMPLADIRQYAVLRSQGDTTLNARLVMLKLHQQRLATRLQELSQNAAALDAKVSHYETLLSITVPPASQRKP